VNKDCGHAAHMKGK